MNWIQKFRESMNLKLFDVRAPALRLLNIVTLMVMVFGAGVVVWFFGFSHPAGRTYLLITLMQWVLGFFVFRFLFTLFFNFNPGGYLQKNRGELFFVLLVLGEVIIYFGFGIGFWQHLAQNGTISAYAHFFVLQLIFWVLVLNIAGKVSPDVGNLRIKPAALLALSFMLLILVGTLLIKLPEMTVVRHISWADALFTSTSACCVTGLSVQDTGTFFTFKGQMVIMLLFQLGGLNMLSIATFLGTFYHRSGSLHSMNLVRDIMDTNQTGNLRIILRRVIYYSIMIEMAGAVLLFFLWGSGYGFKSMGERIFSSVFHSVSAFNNAGFSLFSNNLFHSSIRFQYGAQAVLMVLIVTGGIGFIVLQDLFSVASRRERKRYKWRKLMVNTRLVLMVTLILLTSGAVLFFAFEYNHALSGHTFWGKIMASLFQSVTTRTAGFNTVNMTTLTRPTLLVFMVLMFIGASPGSTGGGIKTTTFAVAFKAAMANIRGRQHVEFFKRTIQWDLINKTYAVIAMALLFLFLFTLLLSLTNPKFTLQQIVFEQISAMGTVGLSLGITGGLSTAGKLILVLSMFVGRIGSLTMAIILSRKVAAKNYRYPGTRLMIG